MIDVEALTAARVEAKQAKEAASERLTVAKKEAGKARGEANRAVGQKLPHAEEAQAAANRANQEQKDAEKAYKLAVEVFQRAVKEENAAIKEKAHEDEVNSVLSSYDVAVTESNEYFGVFYDAHQRYVGFDIGIEGRAEASFNVSNRDELEKIIAALTGFAEQMP